VLTCLSKGCSQPEQRSQLPGREEARSTLRRLNLAGSPSVIGLIIASPGLLLQATRLRVLEAIAEYTVHRPLELRLALSPCAAGSVPETRPDQAQPSLNTKTFTGRLC
jgi:hypothetical protein